MILDGIENSRDHSIHPSHDMGYPSEQISDQSFPKEQISGQSFPKDQSKGQGCSTSNFCSLDPKLPTHEV